jgi:hypothetical protein
MDPSQIIASLNALSFGDLESIDLRLAEAESACASLGAEDVLGRLRGAREALRSADPRAFRRHVEAAVSKLGHLR